MLHLTVLPIRLTVLSIRLTVLACVIAVAGIVDANPRSYTPEVTWSPSDAAVVEGAAEYAFEHSPEYQEMKTELARLSGIIEGIRLAQSGQAPPIQAPPVQAETLPAAQPEAPQPQAILYTKCSSCHSGDAPKAGFIIEPGMDLGSDEAALKVVKILRKTYNGEMPIDGSGNPHPLSDEEYGQLQHELLYNGN